MNFGAFANIIVQSIATIAGVATIATAWNSYQNETQANEKISKSDWLKFCKMFKKYIKEHPELNILIIEAQKKGEATKYQKKDY